MSIYRAAGKRVLDVLVVLIGSPFIALVTLAVWIAVRLSIGRPALFVQQRPGWKAKPFTMRKFRTMTDAVDATGHLLPDADRLTPLGRWLRATSLDELPELWNVFTGEMSLVGPRPLLIRYLPLYNPRQARRHEVRPGITGLAQVNGRNQASWEEKFENDVQYVERYSFAMDVSILWRTASVVFKREGISQSGHATMEEFRGSR